MTTSRHRHLLISLSIYLTLSGCGKSPAPEPRDQFRAGQSVMLRSIGSLAVITETLPHQCSIRVRNQLSGQFQTVEGVPYAELVVISDEAAAALAQAEQQRFKAMEEQRPTAPPPQESQHADAKSSNAYTNSSADPMARFRRYEPGGDDPAKIRADAERAVNDPKFKYYSP